MDKKGYTQVTRCTMRVLLVLYNGIYDEGMPVAQYWQCHNMYEFWKTLKNQG